MPAKVLYDLHKPGRPTKCFYLRIQKAEPGIPSCSVGGHREVCSNFPACAPISRKELAFCASCLPGKALLQPHKSV